MSIINDALKKAQEGLNPKTEQGLYETPLEIETLPPAGQQSTQQKMPMKNKIKSAFTIVCATLVTIASALYIYQQFQSNIPKVKIFAQKSFNQLIHKKEPPELKAKTSRDPVPLAQLTINPTTSSTPNATKPNAPITLNIHGIMANASGNLVLINDQVYQEGDSVGGAKIVKINLDSITTLINGTQETIHVKN